MENKIIMEKVTFPIGTKIVPLLICGLVLEEGELLIIENGNLVAISNTKRLKKARIFTDNIPFINEDGTEEEINVKKPIYYDYLEYDFQPNNKINEITNTNFDYTFKILTFVEFEKQYIEYEETQQFKDY